MNVQLFEMITVALYFFLKYVCIFLHLKIFEYFSH